MDTISDHGLYVRWQRAAVLFGIGAGVMASALCELRRTFEDSRRAAAAARALARDTMVTCAREHQ